MSASLAVWLSGFVFLFCCGMMDVRAVETEFCPLAKSASHCSKAKPDENQIAFLSEHTSRFDCCYFLPAVFDKVRKIQKTQQIALPLNKIKIDSAKYLPVVNDFQPQKIHQITSFCEENIHIKNCVFRI